MSTAINSIKESAIYKLLMINQQKQRKPKHISGDASDESQELEEDSSFEKANQIFALNSQINTLKKQNQKLALDYEAKIKTLQNKYDKLVSQANQRKIENSNFVATVTKLERENEELRNVIEAHRSQIQNPNRRTADFHRSIEEYKEAGLGDPTDLINELLAKDREIEKLNQTIKNLETRPQESETVSPSVSQKQEMLNLREKVEQLRKKEIAYKKQYESMLQSKEEIMKKMISQNQDTLQRTMEIKDKKIGQLNREIEEIKKSKQQLNRQLKESAEKLARFEQMIAKNKNQFTRKEEELKYSLQAERQSLIKALDEKTKKCLMEKDQKQSATEISLASVQNQLLITKQQLSKVKVELSSVTEYNTYLETANRELEEAKKKLQTALYAKDQEIIEVQDKCFMEIAEVKRKMMEQKRELDAKLFQADEQLLAKKHMLEKYERIIDEAKSKSLNESNKQEIAISQTVQDLRNEKLSLQKQMARLQQMNKQRIEAHLEQQKSLRQTYQARIHNLQAQIDSLASLSLKEKQKIISESSQTKQTDQQKYQKLQMVCELLQIEKQQKSHQCKSLLEAKLKLEQKLKEMQDKVATCEGKIKQAKQDYTALEVMYEQLNEKYKTGVKDLEKEIHEMSAKIEEERRKAEKRKTEGSRTTLTMKVELAESLQKIRELEEEIKAQKSRESEHQTENQLLRQQISKLKQELNTTHRERQTMSRSHNRALSQTHQTHEHQKQALLEYIQELEENVHILNTKQSLHVNKEESLQATITQLDRQLKSIKMEYSQSLEEIKELLSKCRQLEQLNKEAIGHREAMKQKYEINCHRFEDTCRQRVQQELESAYDQINKLNKVLMSKEEELSKSKLVYENTQSIHHQNSSAGNTFYLRQPGSVVSVPMCRTYLVSNAPTKDNEVYMDIGYGRLSPLKSQNVGRVRFNRIS